MNTSLAALVRSFAGLNAVVIGEAMLDRYSSGLGRRMCTEAPVPIVDACSTIDCAGGAANTAINVRALGGDVTFISAIGDDAEGRLLSAILQREGVPVGGIVVSPRRQTLAKHRVFAESQMMLRFDQGTTADLDGDDQTRLVKSLEAACRRADVIVISDYCYGILTPEVLAALARGRRGGSPPLVVDSRRLAAFRQMSPTLAKPNFAEAVDLLRQSPSGLADRRHFVLQRGRELLRRTGAEAVAITLDVDGAVVLRSSGGAFCTATTPAPQSQAAGAGDTYLAAFGLALAAGAELNAAAELAAAAASVVVQKSHTAWCSASEVGAWLESDGTAGDLAGLARQMDAHRLAGRRIVFTNGCFDILHHGHITYLRQARALGDVLVVGVNSDESIRRLKGPDRPINCLEDRLGVLASLSCIDHVASFGELRPDRMIRAVRPHVYAKGGDYNVADLPEAALVESLSGRVVILPYLDHHSTSQIVARIRQLPALAAPRDLNDRVSYAMRDLGRRTQSAVH